MMRSFFITGILFISQLLFSETPASLKITTQITDSAKASLFDKKYQLVLPCHDYYNVFKLINDAPEDTTPQKGHDISFIITRSIYGKNDETIIVKKTTSGKTILSNTWLTSLGRDETGYTYLDNNKIITRKYNSRLTKEVNIGKEININFDRHSIVNQGDSIYFYATAVYDKKKKLFGKDTTIMDFDFFKWNKRTGKTFFLFSASDIVPDSLLVPELFESNGIYGNTLDIYHWNKLAKTDSNKLLINFAFSGCLQIDLNTRHIDWAWSYKKSTFSKVKGIGDLGHPYYTHDVHLITSGPFKGYFSYFENGSKGDSAKPFKPARGRIFKINPADNSVEIVFDKIFDISSMALGSVDVMDNFVVISLGMHLPLKEIMHISNTSGPEAVDEFLKNYHHPSVYIFDLKGKEIANFSYPLGFYTYSAWIKRKAIK